MCDRGSQASQFDLFFKRNLGLPQVYLLHGEAGQGHNSFVKRLIIKRIKPYAAAKKGEIEGAVHYIKPMIHPLNSLEDAKESFKISIFEEIAPDYNPERTSIQELCNHPKLKPFPFVIIQHDFVVEEWGKQLQVLIDWYLNSYWMGYAPGTSQIQFLMFLNFIYPSSEHYFWSRLRPSRKFKKSAFANFLSDVSEVIGKVHPCLLFEELGHPDRKEVCRTLGELGFHEDEECPDWLKDLFREKRDKVRMVEIEKLLKTLHPTPPFAQRSII